MRAPDLSSGIVRSLDALTDLLLLNLLWLLTGASIVTLGASTAAVYGALRALEREEDGGVVRNFFRCWRRSWVFPGSGRRPPIPSSLPCWWTSWTGAWATGTPDDIWFATPGGVRLPCAKGAGARSA